MRTTTLHTLAAVAAIVTLPTLAAAQKTTKEMAPTKNIVETAVAAGQLQHARRRGEGRRSRRDAPGQGPFTVFAPTDAAFAKLPAGTVEALLADKAKLASILTYHVVAGKVMAGDIVKANGATPTTVNGQSVDVVVRGGKVYVNGAQVVSADIVASNGVIHVIDAVLMPKAAPMGGGR